MNSALCSCLLFFVFLICVALPQLDLCGVCSFGRYKEFKAALKDPYADENAPDRIAAVGVFDKVRIEPKQIVELTDLEDVPEDSEPLPPDAVKKIKLKFQVAKKFTAVWDTTKTRSQKPLSIWKPSMDTGVFKKNCVRLCLGHVAVGELKDPTKAKRLKKLPFEIIEVSDTGSGHKAVVDQVVQALFPYPLRFHLVWSQSRSKKPMYIWNAVPPSNKYVAMGMVLTDTEDPPDRDCMRCVCIHLLKPTEAAPVKIWDDAGGGGRPGSVWYVAATALCFMTSKRMLTTKYMLFLVFRPQVCKRCSSPLWSKRNQRTTTKAFL